MSEPYRVVVPVAGAAWLSSNQRLHWARRHEVVRAWRHTAAWCARASGVPSLGPTRVVAVLQMTGRRRSRIDPGNYTATAKPAVDGLVDVGIWPDDSSDWVTGPDMRLGGPVHCRDDEALVLELYGAPCCAAADCHHQAPTG